jgi:CofD-related protein of GAK system
MEEHLVPLKSSTKQEKQQQQQQQHSPNRNRRLLSKEEQLVRLRGSSFSDSLDRSDGVNDESSNNSNYHFASTFQSVSITRLVAIPDRVRIDRSLRLPEYGPKILFFSGGTAIRDLSEVLKDYTHNSIHLITPFDSGGSSAEIRRAFDMLSVGDLRNRLLALAAKNESTMRNNPQIVELFSHRLEKTNSDVATEEFLTILVGRHPLIRAVRMPMRTIFQNHLRWFANRMPEDFDLRGASIGNLIITGCFLEHDRDIVSVIFMIAKFLGVKGFVRPLTAANLHIRTLYNDGREEVGQHLMNKKESPSSSKIIEIDLVDYLECDERQESQTCHIDIVSSYMVSSADLIVFPMGSFFASILVNLLPTGVGRAVVARKCPKLYVPNTGYDSEMNGYTLAECVKLLIDMVRADFDDPSSSSSRQVNTTSGKDIPIKDILNFVLIDSRNCEYSVEVDKMAIEELGVVVIDVPLVENIVDGENADKSSKLEPLKVVEVLLSLAS